MAKDCVVFLCHLAEYIVRMNCQVQLMIETFYVRGSKTCAGYICDWCTNVYVDGDVNDDLTVWMQKRLTVAP